MNVASTELTDLCKKVFEGKGFPTGDYADCAHAITWLEMHGLPVLRALVESDPALPIPKSQPTTVLFEDETLAVLDAAENGGLIYGSLALDLAYLKALSAGFAVVKLRRARHGQLMIPCIVETVQRGVNVVVCWREGAQEHVVTMPSSEAYPCYTITRVSDSSAPRTAQEPPMGHPLTIVCSTHVAILQQYPDDSSNQPPLCRKTPADFAASYQHHNEDGLAIDEALWAQLVTLAQNVLVEATEHSRFHGAGEVASSDQ